MALTDGQQRCVDTLNRPLVVAAGAGSGKTFTLTKRIVGALQKGFVADIDEVCAITFTNKAAAELKSRLKAELRACGLIDQAQKADEAWVSTIHGMCARILRAHALELGIDPAFTVADGAQVATYLSRAVDEVLVQAQAEKDSPALNALFAEYSARSFGGFGSSVEGMLSDLVNEASSHMAGADAFVLPGATMDPAVAVEQVVDLAEGLLVAAAGEKESAKRDEWMASTDQHVQAARAAIAEGIADHIQALRVIAPFKLAKTFGSKDYKAQVDEARGALGACVMEVRLGAARPHLETLVMLAGRVLDSFARMKRADGVLDNNDLLVLAAQALEGYPAIADCYTNKFKLVMVDEFQDTDQMQVDMIKRIAGQDGERLCTVGDAQQSIYRFRGADVSVYRRHLESVRKTWPESVIQLADNFRSHADVLAFVDRVFEKPDMFGGEFMSLHHGRDESKGAAPFASGDPRIIVQHTSRPSRGVNSAQAVEFAAGRIADTFAAFAQAGHAAGDMVVLLGRMTHADLYAQALRDRGLPCVVSGGSVFARTPEVGIASELLCVLANPRQTQSLFNVLTSSLFALTAGDLLTVGGLEGFWKAAYSDDAVDMSPQLECALRVMARARRSIGRVPVARIMEHVVTDSGWLSRKQAEGAEGLASAANMIKAIRMIRGIEESGACGPSSVDRRFTEMLASSKEAPGALSVSGGDSVRIMTVHASKGLEFPIVAVAEFSERRAPSSRLLSTSIAGMVYVSLDLGRTLDSVGDSIDSVTMGQMRDYALGLAADEDELAAIVVGDGDALNRRLAMREYAAVGDEEEAKRLLYVALTRAREALVVSTVGVRSKDNPAGVPKSAFSGVFCALDPAAQGFAEGRGAYAFGGSAPALVECIALSADETESDAASDFDSVDLQVFPIPADDDAPVLMPETFKPSHQRIYSYSSISDAAHEGDVLDSLADEFAVAVDAAAPGDEFSESNEDWRFASTALFDDDFWDVDPSRAFDEDRATDLGTAFHRLAQYAVLARQGEDLLVSPSADRIEALSRNCNLDGGQRVRLDEALNRWFGSDVAREMASYADLSPEVPFFVSVPVADCSENVYLEGEIDLLGLDSSLNRAVVVDYKTGGHADETEDDLRRKHVLQAACYAYAIMLQGIQEVEAVFVRVERPRADDDMQPQCVRYRFDQTDMPSLATAVAKAISQYRA